MSSDESDFYGDEDGITELEAQVDGFDVDKWWEEQKSVLNPLRLQAKSSVTTDSSHLHNPYAGIPYAWQLTETVDDFLKRLPPRTTEETPEEPWIYICNPYIARVKKEESTNQKVRGCEDEAPEEEGARLSHFIEGGMERLHLASEFREYLKTSTRTQAVITRESNKAAADATKELLGLAHACHIRCGKWMLFCEPKEVNETWSIIAKATANNELGIAAKVGKRPNGDSRQVHLLCVYTSDFADMKDVGRVIKQLKVLDLVPGRKPLYYKPDAFTYLGISHNNAWGLKASIYNSNEFLGK